MAITERPRVAHGVDHREARVVHGGNHTHIPNTERPEWHMVAITHIIPNTERPE